MEIIKKLKSKGMTKYAIAKAIGVTWQTINMWEREVFKPKQENMDKLEALYKGGV